MVLTKTNSPINKEVGASKINKVAWGNNTNKVAGVNSKDRINKEGDGGNKIMVIKVGVEIQVGVDGKDKL
jgi:hypothetical protein